MTAVLAPGLERRLKAEIAGEVLFSSFDRGRYATDASHYQVMPVGVVVPHSVDDVMRAMALSNALLFCTNRPSVLLAICRIESMREAGSCSSFSRAFGALPFAV